MTKVQFKQGTYAEIDAASCEQGILYFASDTGALAYDLGGGRKWIRESYVNAKTEDEWEAVKGTYVPAKGELVIYTDKDGGITDIKIGGGNAAVGDIASINLASYISSAFQSKVNTTTLQLAL